jgi:UDP-N-acetylglucosamine diphosphorylase/glucosamine-1-phosphate N-acetyltransferase
MTVKENIAIVILAAGKGKRMKSSKAKVLHEVLGQPMVFHVIESAKKVAGDNIILVIGNQAEEVRRRVSARAKVKFALQDEQLGTGHAVLCAMPHIPGESESVVVLCGDVPLIKSDTILALIDYHQNTARDISVLAVNMDDPKGYGRIVYDKNQNVSGIIEEADADEGQQAIHTVNTGIFCVRRKYLDDALRKIEANNIQGEFYLTDIIKIGYQENKRIGVLINDRPEEFVGINSKSDLRRVENALKNRR